jgi:hypothetical protein
MFLAQLGHCENEARGMKWKNTTTMVGRGHFGNGEIIGTNGEEATNSRISRKMRLEWVGDDILEVGLFCLELAIFCLPSKIPDN